MRKGIELPRNELIMIILAIIFVVALVLAYFRMGSGVNDFDFKNSIPGVSGFLQVAGGG